MDKELGVYVGREWRYNACPDLVDRGRYNSLHVENLNRRALGWPLVTLEDLKAEFHIAQTGHKEDTMSEYIIWNPSSSLPPTVRFKTRQDAIKAAAVMARKTPGDEFIVAKLTNSAKLPPADVVFTDLEK